MISLNDNIGLNSRQKALIQKICSNPTPADVEWKEVESLLGALIDVLGGKADKKRSGSRVCFKVGKQKLILHKPHPDPNMDKNAVRNVKDLLINTGVVT
jgi:hypothetical protein